jgi:transcriptional regulator with XRE-family HTH domain
MIIMTANGGHSATTHFGRQMKKERLARGWSLREFAARSGIDIGSASLIENGKRPPNERVAIACDAVFPERGGWFREYYEESKDWMPAGFRDWPEYENRARELLIWAPGIVDGIAQTEGYARELLSAYPGVTAEVIEARLRGRMERQKRLLRDDGPAVVLLVDMVALYRAIGSARIMAGQCARLAEIAKLDAVTVQVVPPVTIPLATASVMIAGDAAYTEHALGGAVFTEAESVTRLRRLVGSVRGEARPVSESLALIRKADRSWTGVSQPRAATAGRRASK